MALTRPSLTRRRVSPRPNIIPTDRTTLSQEIRLESTAADSRLNWVAGVFYTHARENTSVSVIDPSLPGEFEALYGVSWNTAVGPLLPGGYLLQDPLRVGP